MKWNIGSFTHPIKRDTVAELQAPLPRQRQKSIRTAAMLKNSELCTIQTEVAWKKLTSEWVSDASQRILFIAPPYHNTLFTISPF